MALYSLTFTQGGRLFYLELMKNVSLGETPYVFVMTHYKGNEHLTPSSSHKVLFESHGFLKRNWCRLFRPSSHTLKVAFYFLEYMLIIRKLMGSNGIWTAIIYNSF